jgi:hypothetical protein
MNLPKSDKLNRRHVFLAFRTKMTRLTARINARIGGCPVACMGIVIWGEIDEQYKFYGLKWDEKTVVEMNWSRINKENFILVNTRYPTTDLVAGWKRSLLRQKARHIDRLFLRYRCVKCLRPLLDSLPKKWHYRFGDILASIYLRRRMTNE